ncbi:MAG: hypothetical protein J6R25_00560 [Bacteroidales bacterium]|nr:hypothetical protein [Bacteroidales bacterium]
MINFRKLKADEIECRIGQTFKAKQAISLLLYKNARCDMALLDEVVGAENWQREHYECKGNLYCRVGIKNNTSGEWVWKSDAGVESNTEAIKGESSDSFKRACVNWGIGRELYTAPFIYIELTDKEWNNGSPRCKFDVAPMGIGYDDQGNIVFLEIVDAKGNVRFSMGEMVKLTKSQKKDDQLFDMITEEDRLLALSPEEAILEVEKCESRKALNAIHKVLKAKYYKYGSQENNGYITAVNNASLKFHKL